MGKTKIQWCDSVWNVVTGCTKVSEGCRNCYAERMAERFWGGRKFSEVQCHEDRLAQPLHWRKPRTIFVNSMGDLFHRDVPDEFIDKVFAVMTLASWHTFIVLTKRPERMQEWFEHAPDLRLNVPTAQRAWHVWSATYGIEAPSHVDWAGNTVTGWPLLNVILGVSVEDQRTLDERIPLLLQTPAVCRAVSSEPLLEGIRLRPEWLELEVQAYGAGGLKYFPRIDWLICGGETGPNARPMHPDWARNLRDQCQEAGVPFFFKNWGQYVTEEQAPEDIILPGRSILPWGKKGPDVYSIGPKHSGRLLDGREWNETPEMVSK